MFILLAGLFNGHPSAGGRYNIYNGYVGPSSVATSTNGDYANYDDEYNMSKNYSNK